MLIENAEIFKLKQTMSIPTKGTRKILVDGKPFIWLIRRQPTYTQECFQGGNLHVAVEHAEEPGGRVSYPHRSTSSSKREYKSL
ncbi:hypothetical protein [Microcoleus sp. B3-D7]|uniref:hypothetical protein n=1 Tax=Microcoleus sp. B3-D7 TaxID=2818659 RepID=UPI002FD1907C